MLRRLLVENYALIDSLEMDLSRSLNIITGETGAGKSILLGALGLVLGNRADTGALRDSGRNCVVEAQFDISEYRLEEFFEESDLEYDPHTVIRRVITPAGKTRSYINDLPVQLTTLRELSYKLIDVHSQNQTRLIAEESFRTEIIDSVVARKDLGEKYHKIYREYRSAERELKRMQDEAEKNSRDEDYLRHQYEELTMLKLREGELEELEAEQRELANAGQIQETLSHCLGGLDDDEHGILPRLKQYLQGITHIAQEYPRAEEFAARLNSTYVELKDIASEIGSETERIEDNPGKLARLDERLGQIYSLMQKHRIEEFSELLALREELGRRLDDISGNDEAVGALAARVKTLHQEALSTASLITAARTAAAGNLGTQVEQILARLGMASVKFVCEILPAGELTPSGGDKIRFLFSANASSAAQPLEKVASGGEMSRVMLALKSIVARNSQLPTIIFDEIDTGVSGRIADAMGDIMEELSREIQIINITHLPQVASKGDTHFLVYKTDDQGVTNTHIELLGPERRIEEIAKMLSGSKVTDAAVAQARLLLGAS